MSTQLYKERQSNIETLRIICMFLIVLHHFVVHGGSIGMEGVSYNRTISLIILPAGKICFNTFVAISTWFLVKSSFKGSRFIKMWLQVLFYNIVGMVATCLVGGEYADGVTWRTWLGCFFPITGNSHGFAAAYLAFYLLTPFLKIITEKANKNQICLLIILLTITQLNTGLLGHIIGYTQTLVSEMLLFVLCYFISFYLQEYPYKWQSNKAVLLIVFVGLWGITALSRIMDNYHPGNWIVSFFANFVTGSEFSYVNIVAGYALFLLFNGMKTYTNKFVNSIASTMFGVLLIHDHNYFRPVMWRSIVKAQEWYYVPTIQFVLRMIVVSTLIMLVGVLVDFARTNLLEKRILKSHAALWAVDKIDKMSAGDGDR